MIAGGPQIFLCLQNHLLIPSYSGIKYAMSPNCLYLMKQSKIFPLHNELPPLPAVVVQQQNATSDVF